MFTKFEHYAATSMMGSREEAPPRQDGHLQFDHEWEKFSFGVAIALSKQGHFEWDDFRETLMKNIAEWELTHKLDDERWDYYQCWLSALEEVVINSGIVNASEMSTQFNSLLNCKSLVPPSVQ